MDNKLTVTEAADMLRVSGRTVRRWIIAGTLPGVRLPGRGGGEWRIPREAVDRLLTHGITRTDKTTFNHAPRCAATTKAGTPCGGLAMRGTLYCRHHQEREK